MSVPGVSVNSGVLVTTAAEAYLKSLRAALSSSVPLKVTSGERTPEAQAAAMLKNFATGGAAVIRSTYRSNKAIVEKLLAAPKTVAAWAAIIRAEGGSLSRHLSTSINTGAIDLHVRTLPEAQKQAIKDAVSTTGGRWLHELVGTDREHLHVDLPRAYAVASLVETTVRKTAGPVALIWLTGGVFVAGMLLVGYGRRRRAATPVVISNPRRRRRHRKAA